MPYIGHSPTNAGNFYILDDFNGLGQDGSSSTYDQNANGTIVNYKLMVAGVAITPNVDNLIVTIDGVLQHPTDAYTISGSILTFTGAPASGVDFHVVIMGQSSTVGEGSIGADELEVSGDGTNNQLLKSDGDGTFSWINQNTVTASTANIATHVTVADNESTNENNLIPFVEDASGAGNVGLESDGDLHYNPSTGKLTATQLAGTLQTAAQTNITSVGTLTGLTIENATNPLIVGDGTKDLFFDPDSNGVMVSTATSQGGDGHYYNDAGGEVWTTIDGTAKVKVKASAFEVTPNATFAGAIDTTGTTTIRANSTYYSERTYVGDNFVFPSSETSDGVTFKITGGAGNTSGNFFKFQTQAGGATPATALTIAKDSSATFAGKVQIGDSVGNSILRVRQDSSQTVPCLAASAVTLSGYTAVNKYGGGIGFVWENAGADIEPPAWIGTQAEAYSSHTQAALVFATRNVTSNTAPTERMRIHGGGYISVGKQSTGEGRIDFESELSAATTARIRANGDSYLLGGGLGIGGARTACNNNGLFIDATGNDAYTPTGFNDKSNIRLNVDNVENNYCGITFTHDGNTEGALLYHRESATTDRAEFVFQGYDGNANAYKEYMRIDWEGNAKFAGRVTAPQPAFYANKNGHMFEQNGSIKMTGWSAITNVGSHWDTGNDKFVAPVAGSYQFNLNVMSGQTAGDAQYRIFKNGSIYAGSNSISQGGTWRQTTVTAVMTLAVNDYVEFYLYSSQTNGSLHHAYGGTYTHIDGHLIG